MAPTLVELAWRAQRRLRDGVAESRARLAAASGDVGRAFAASTRGRHVAPEFRAALARVFPGERAARVARVRALGLEAGILAEADAARAHVFDLLGSGPTNLGPRIDWHRDFKSGHRWDPRAFHRRTPIANAPGGYDVKVPWELSRAQHLPRLGQAFWLTGERAYAGEVARQLDAWIDDNPWRFGVNWACAMDVAIRAVNWLWALAFVADAVDDGLLVRVARSLHCHGRHLAANLEGRPGRAENSNHYVADLAGLAHLGLACPFLAEADGWRALGTRELWREVAAQTDSDGMNHEGSLAYHRLVGDMIAATVARCRQAGEPVPAGVTERLAAMLDLLSAVARPDGGFPLVGDHDGGRFVRLDVGRAESDPRGLLGLGRHAGGDDAEAVWQLPLGDLAAAPASPAPASRAFRTAGLYVLRSPSLYLLATGAASGSGGIGGHSHADLLSFEAADAERALVVDPGTGVYTQDHALRDRLRGARAHNTIVVDGEEQGRLGGLWELRGKPAARVVEWAPPRLTLAHGRHTRTFVVGEALEITDRLDGEGMHDVEIRFHLAAGAELLDGEVRLGRWRLRCEAAGLHLRLEQAPCSPRYGVVEQRPVLVGTGRVRLPFTLRTRLWTPSS